MARYSQMVFRLASIRCRNRHDAEDVFQEVFLRLVTKSPVFESEEHIKAWLIRATLHVAADKRKTDARWRKCCAVGPRLPGARDEEVRQALSELDADDRNVVYLYYYEGYKLREIAGLVGLPENTVSSRLSRARARLGKILEEEGDDRA